MPLVNPQQTQVKICSKRTFWSAIISGNVNRLEKLNYVASYLESTNFSYCTPILYSVKNNHLAMLSHLIQLGVNLDQECQISDQWGTKYTRMYPVTLAAEMGHVECLRLLIAAQANLNSCSYFHRQSAIIQAVINNHLDCLKLLTDAGADVNQVDICDETPVMYAAYRNRVDCLKMLIAAGADLNKEQELGSTAVSMAVNNNNFDCLKLLTDAGANSHLPAHYPPIISAICNNSIESIRLLLKAGAKIDPFNGYLLNYLDYFLKEGDEDAASLLIYAGIKKITPVIF